MTVDDDPGQELMRETGRFLFFFAPEVEVIAMKQILVAGIGNAWMQRRRLRRRGRQAARASASCRPRRAVFDFGTGGLDLAYEVMRGYDALVLVDISRQGGEPGTLYVMEADEEDVEAGIEDGQVINPHGMDPADGAALRQDARRLAGQGRGDRVRAGDGGGDGFRPERRGARARWTGAVELVLETIDELRADAAYAAGVTRARAVALQRDRQHRGQARRGRPGDAS